MQSLHNSSRPFVEFFEHWEFHLLNPWSRETKLDLRGGVAKIFAKANFQSRLFEALQGSKVETDNRAPADPIFCSITTAQNVTHWAFSSFFCIECWVFANSTQILCWLYEFTTWNWTILWFICGSKWTLRWLYTDLTLTVSVFYLLYTDFVLTLRVCNPNYLLWLLGFICDSTWIFTGSKWILSWLYAYATPTRICYD